MKRKELILNRIFPIALVLVMTFLTTFAVAEKYNSENAKPKETNFAVLAYLNLAPDTNTRPVTDVDKDTKLRIVKSSTGREYALYQSRNFSTNDYGKTFLIRSK